MSDATATPGELAIDLSGDRIVGWVRWLSIAMGTTGIFLAMNQVFNWNFFGALEIFGVDLRNDHCRHYQPSRS